MGAHLLGRIDGQGYIAEQPRCRKLAAYFHERDCWIDARAPNCLQIDADSNWGWCINVVTLSHDARPGLFGRTYGRLCRVDANAFIAGFCTLYNCHIGEGAVVALGSVVRSMDVAPYTMVAGNPARLIMRLVDGSWVRV